MHTRLAPTRRRWYDATVIRVCSSQSGSWEVVQEPVFRPLASFSRKDDAVAYALDLARTKSNWQIYLSDEGDQADGSDWGIALASGENVTVGHGSGAGEGRTLS
jgi:hypothetical protein